MVIKLEHLTIENFGSFGYAEVDLNDRGYTSLVGINQCPTDNASANGTGKSLLLDSICYALTGTTIRGINKNLVNIHTTGGMKVELTFDVDGVPYKIIRAKDHKELGTTIKLFVNGEDKSGKGVRDTEKLISEYLPDLTFELISSVIILGQGMPQKFTNNTPSGRKEVLEKLSKSDFMIEDIKTRLVNRKSALTQQSRDLELKLTSAESQQRVYQQQLTQYQAQLENLQAPDPQELTNIYERVTELQNQAAVLSQQIVDKKLVVDNLTQQQNELAVLQSTEIVKIQDKYRQEIDSIRQSAFHLDAEYSSLNREIKRLESITDVCPTCGQKLPDVHKVDTSDMHKQLDDLATQKSQLSAKLQELSTQQQQEVTQVEEQFKSQRLVLVNRASESRTELTALNKELSSYDDEIRHQSIKAATVEANLKNFENTKSSIEQSVKSTSEAIDKLQQEIVYYSLGRDEIAGRLDAVNKMTTIATRDFRGFLLTGVIDYIDSRAKSYCQDIFETNRIQFALDGNNLNITYDDKLYENLSGGEQKKVDIIAQLSLRDMLCQFSGFSCNVLALDEFTDALDAVGCQKVIDTVAKRLTDIESVFLVTHRSNLSLPTDNTITIIKDSQGVSRIA